MPISAVLTVTEEHSPQKYKHYSNAGRCIFKSKGVIVFDKIFREVL
jgi:hypothetical protein